MPGTSKVKNTRGIEINFSESDHKYWSIIDGEEIRYVSGTTFVSRFFPKFDPDGSIARRKSAEMGITVDELRKMWKDKGTRACEYGTRIHESMEDHLLGRKLRNNPQDDREKIVFSNVEQASRKIMEKFEPIGIEKIIFDERIRIAGTIDLLAKSKKDGRIWIIDYKTNQEIETENKWKKFGLHPIEHIMDTNYGHYTMQLNLYKYILRESGYIDDDNIGMCLLHITEKTVKPYMIEDHSEDIRKMIEVYRGMTT